MPRSRSSAKNNSTENLGFESRARGIWLAVGKDDGDPFEEKMPRLVAELEARFAESARLEKSIRQNLKWLANTGGQA